jgi:hypothetical protein
MPCLISILYNTYNRTINNNIGNIVSAVKPFSLEVSGKTHFSRPDPSSFLSRVQRSNFIVETFSASPSQRRERHKKQRTAPDKYTYKTAYSCDQNLQGTDPLRSPPTPKQHSFSSTEQKSGQIELPELRPTPVSG